MRKTLSSLLLSVVVGLSAGVGLAYFVEYLDTSVKTIEDIEQYLEVPVLGVIPQKVKPLTDDAAEALNLVLVSGSEGLDNLINRLYSP